MDIYEMDMTTRSHATTFRDLPRDILSVIGAHLGLAGTWRSIDEVVRDQAALAMASRCTETLAEIVADGLCARIDAAPGTSSSYISILKPSIPRSFDGVLDTVQESSPIADLRMAANECGVASARSKVETFRRVRDAVEARAELVRSSTLHARAFEAGPANAPVLKNPISKESRERVLEPERLSATGARDRFVLTDRNLRTVTCELRQNPYCKSAAPMRLYRVSDLRILAENKHGGIVNIESKRIARTERGAAVSDAMERAKETRLAKLTRALNERGCVLRADSQLCTRYIDTGRGDVDDIADTMAEMRFCFEHTRYAEILDDNIASARETGERFDFHEESQIARVQAVFEFKRSGQNLYLLPIHLVDP
jgi:hypothetical protein